MSGEKRGATRTQQAADSVEDARGRHGEVETREPQFTQLLANAQSIHKKVDGDHHRCGDTREKISKKNRSQVVLQEILLCVVLHKTTFSKLGRCQSARSCKAFHFHCSQGGGS